MRKLILLLLLIGVPFGGWGAYWWSWANDLEDQVTRSIAYVNERLMHSRSRLRIGYDDIAVANFLGTPHVYLRGASVVTKGYPSNRVDADWVRLEPAASGDQFRVIFPEWLTAEEKQSKKRSTVYEFRAQPQPSFWLRTPAAQDAEPKNKGPLDQLVPKAPKAPNSWPSHIPHQFALKLPAQLDLTSRVEGTDGNTARFTLPALPIKAWQPIPLKPDDKLDFFLSLLAEVAEAKAPQP
jgi:hypothetical protein